MMYSSQPRNKWAMQHSATWQSSWTLHGPTSGRRWLAPEVLQGGHASRAAGEHSLVWCLAGVCRHSPAWRFASGSSHTAAAAALPINVGAIPTHPFADVYSFG